MEAQRYPEFVSSYFAKEAMASYFLKNFKKAPGQSLNIYEEKYRMDFGTDTISKKRNA